MQLAGTAFFQEGSTTLSSEGIATMRSVAEELRGKRWIIEVRRHPIQPAGPNGFRYEGETGCRLPLAAFATKEPVS